jgi:nicotinamidase-related amidase
LNNLRTPGSREGEILDEVAPVGDEIVLTKTASSVFNATNIHYVLTNLGVRNLVVCGVVTTGCVETAVRDAADLGYRVALVEDACGSLVEEMHYASVRVLRDVYASIVSTDEVVAALTPVASTVVAR